MIASNTKGCFRDVIGRRVVGVLFDALPAHRRDLADGNKTLVFDDGTGLTISDNGAFWRESKEDVDRAVRDTRKRLETVQRDLQGVLDLAGVIDP